MTQLCKTKQESQFADNVLRSTMPTVALLGKTLSTLERRFSLLRLLNKVGVNYEYSLYSVRFYFNIKLHH